MSRKQQVVGTFEIAGIPCRVDCRDEDFRERLASRYAAFATKAPFEVSLRVGVTPTLPTEEAGHEVGPFARIGGRDGVLTIQGARFRGTYHETSGEGWIVQPPDPAALETFFTAICAGRLLRSKGFLLHAAAITAGDGAHVFFGPSGSGKSTVAELIGEGVISDEVVAIRQDGERYRISAVPWRGQRLAAYLGGLFRLQKSQETAFTRLGPVEAVRQLLPCVFFPRAEPWEVDRFLEIAKDLVKRVPCYEMSFTPDGSFWEAIPGRRTEEIYGLAL